MRFKRAKITGLSGLLVLSLSCNREKNPLTFPANPFIDSVTLPAKWNSRSDQLYQVEIRVRDTQGYTDIDSAFLKIYEGSSTLPVYSDFLYDDAAYYHAGDGDVVAGDGVYSNRLGVTQISTAGTDAEYIFEFSVTDKEGHRSVTEERTVLFAPDYAPLITGITAPDTIPEIPAGQILAVAVADADGLSDITRVYFESQSQKTGALVYESDMYNDGNYELHGDQAAGDSIFSVRLNSSFSEGKQGNYDLSFHVLDSFLEQNEIVPLHRLFVGNSPPRIVDIVCPESVVRPAVSGGYKRTLLTVQVQDAQGLNDIDSVYFYSRKPDSTLANNGNPIALVDNGYPFNEVNPAVETGDVKAGDGIYSYSLLIFSDYNLGTYTFTFYVRDKAGNLSTPEVRTLEIIDL